MARHSSVCATPRAPARVHYPVGCIDLGARRGRTRMGFGLAIVILTACSAGTPSEPVWADLDGVAAQLVLLPDTNLTVPVGDRAVVSASLLDATGEPIAAAGFEWTISDDSVVRIVPAGERVTLEGRHPGAVTLQVTSRPETGTVALGREPVRASAAVLVPDEAPAEPPRSEPPGTPPDAPADSAPDARLFGLHMDLTWNGWETERTEAMDRAKELGTEVSRNSFLWHLVEPVQGTRDWSTVDHVVDGLLAREIEPLMVIYGSPAWANGVDGFEDAYLHVPEESQQFALWLDRYADFVREAAARYAGRVNKWELWNEQNEHYFWKPAPNLERYIAFFERISEAIQQEVPNAEIAVGGLAGLCCASGVDIPGIEFLHRLYENGIESDAVSIHPYAGQYQAPDNVIAWENNFTDIALVRDLMVRFGREDASLWVTEWGWPTDRVSEATQAEYVERSLEMLRDEFTYVTVATYFIDRDRPPLYYHGLYTSDYRLKPAGQRYRDLVTGMP